MVIGEQDKLFGSFWNDKYVSGLYEKWIHCDGNYAYKRFEVLRTYSGEMLFINEHKATLSKEKSNAYIDTDQLKMFKGFFSKDKTSFNTETKTKTKTKDMDKTIYKTKTKTNTKTEFKDKDKTIPKTETKTKTNTKTKDMDKTIPKTKDKEQMMH